MGCLDESTLALLRDQQLRASDRARIVDHLDECAACRSRALRFTIDESARTTNIQFGSDSSYDTLVHSSDEQQHEKPSGPALWAGESVDHFEVKLMLGRGAMGEVYLARDTRLGRKVALKMMRPEMFHSNKALSRFQHEARAMARINHPNVVTIHAVGDHGGVPYVAMEFVRGESLYERLDGGRLAVEEAVRITLGITAALRQAHELGIVHRDLKPENVIASRDGDVRVLDFGLAKMLDLAVDDSFAPTPIPTSPREEEIATRVGARVGTPLYMSPEQWRCETITDATDMWALGVMLHEMLSGRVPFKGADMADLARKVCSADEPVVVDEAIDGPLRELVTRCLERDPSTRPSANEVMKSLRAVQQALAAPSLPPSLPEPLPPPSDRRGWLSAVGAIVLLGGGIALGSWLSSGGSSDSEVTTASSTSAAAPPPAPPPLASQPASAAPAAPASASASASAPASAPKPLASPRGTTQRTPARRSKRPPKDPFSKAPSNAGF